MPTVPDYGEYAEAMDAQARSKRPTPEQVLMTAADMKARGQLYSHPTDYSDPKASVKLPFAGGGRGERAKKTKRR